jgi:hypothetical protein
MPPISRNISPVPMGAGHRTVGSLRRIGEWRGLSRALLTAATIHVRLDRTSAAEPLLAEALELLGPWAGADEAVAVHTWIAHLRYWYGDIEGAEADLLQARTHLSGRNRSRVGMLL